ncbi:MAG: VTT domain-containing protein [Propionibacteriaceae bacterium]|nr:VTT domain-containing protein [Propionibacteriaceae bacterium]
MMEWLDGQSFVFVALFLTGVAGFRSQCTFWLGRGIRAGIFRFAWAQKLATDKEKNAEKQIQKWGWPVIPFSFLIPAFQTAVHLTAGLIGWRWLPYTLAAIPGWILWGCLYAAGGLAAFVALVALARESLWLAALAVLLLAGGIAAIIILRKRAKKRKLNAELDEIIDAELIEVA